MSKVQGVEMLRIINHNISTGGMIATAIRDGQYEAQRANELNAAIQKLNSQGRILTRSQVVEEVPTGSSWNNPRVTYALYWEADSEDPVYQEYQKKLEEEKAQRAQKKSSSGCYVATCVYGSYDCPEVWTLRRYRDNCLSQTWYGRLFIHIYYAVSPTVVKLLGNAKWFKKVGRYELDKLVGKLYNHGFDNSPYKDKQW